MKKQYNSPFIINSVSELHRLLGLPKPGHPLVSAIDLSEIKEIPGDEKLKVVGFNFYSICIKRNFKGKLKYGQNYYDFDEGVMSFFSPGQIVSAVLDDIALSGWWLVVHPDFIRNYPLGKVIKDYGYFSYAVNEALHLSGKEETMIELLLENIAQEYRSAIDNYSQDVIVSHIELLLNYCNRFYNRQFITRKNASNDLLSNLETLLSDYFNTDKVQKMGLPTVQYISDQLHVSPSYLKDMLKMLTGQNTQQHIHNKLIEKAKEMLTTTPLSVSEIAYQLGFAYPQSFNKLFKGKTNVSPLDFRASFS